MSENGLITRHSSLITRLGILGGTFDPPHFGHLRLAEAALTQLQLDQVLFAPAGVQPLKQEERSSTPEHRARMVELAIAGNLRFALSRADLDRPGPHYTVDLLTIIQQQYPDAALWFIMGEDSLGDLLRWRDPARVIHLARLAVLRRPGYEPDWPTLDRALPDLGERLDWIDHAELDISASDLRQRVQHGQSLDALVPPKVIEFIHTQRLYQQQ
ncbi:MAG: nicotinate (nicotinamide) nucleotide adenylyltransferase [Chloroflexi bacterium]|nr:nicotinate (nicotinamide) nucleotide adenylyltransferase [Chloroflexota bacterium]